MRSGPHQRNIGKGDVSKMLRAVRRLCGQSSTAPRGVRAQSMDRMRAPASPPPPRVGSASGLSLGSCIAVAGGRLRQVGLSCPVSTVAVDQSHALDRCPRTPTGAWLTFEWSEASPAELRSSPASLARRGSRPCLGVRITLVAQYPSRDGARGAGFPGHNSQALRAPGPGPPQCRTQDLLTVAHVEGDASVG